MSLHLYRAAELPCAEHQQSTINADEADDGGNDLGTSESKSHRRILHATAEAGEEEVKGKEKEGDAVLHHQGHLPRIRPSLSRSRGFDRRSSRATHLSQERPRV